uniref:DUF1981 domain-containing protein n=1 Tax=Panagrellus redivivus TaxID=6233 RepID=A0A7E4VEJ0_PANRE
MDEIIDKLLNHADAKGLNCLSEMGILAKGCAAKQDMPPFERRKRCLALFEAALSSGKPKLAYIGCKGIEQMLREPAFFEDANANKDDQRTAAQTIAALNSMPSWDKSAQTHAISVIVQTISGSELRVLLADVYSAMNLLTRVYAGATSDDAVSVRLAVRAALTQLLNSFCINRYAKVDAESQEELVVLMDMTALVKELLMKLDGGQQSNVDELLLGLDSLVSAISVQPAYFWRHQPLLNVFTTELMPSLLCLLQISGEKPEKPKNFLERARSTTTKNQRATIFSSTDTARSFYTLIEHILRLMAPLEAPRSLTVELFRASMVVPPPERRYEPLKLLKRFATTPTLLASLLRLMALDDAVWPVIVECVEEAAKQTASTEVSVDAIRTLQILFDGFDSVAVKADQFQFDEGFYVKVSSNNESFGKNDAQNDSHNVAEEVKQHPLTNDESILSSAGDFVDQITAEIPAWFETTCPRQVDAAIQTFATTFTKDTPQNLLNVDAAYLAAYAVLSHGFHPDVSSSRSAFFAKIRSGSIVYANDAWVNAVWQIMTTYGTRFLESIAIPEDKKCNLFETPLASVVADYDGWKHKLLVYQPTRSETAADEDMAPVIIEERCFKSKDVEEVDTWMHRLLSGCWATIQGILSRYPLKNGAKTASESVKFTPDGAEATLEAMRSFCRILRHFSMGREILWLFEKFGEEICNLEELTEFVQAPGSEKKSWPVHRVDVLGIDLLLENALPCGTLSPGTWKYVVRAIEYVAELERHQFQMTKTANTTFESTSNGATVEGIRDLLTSKLEILPLKTLGRVLDELMLKTHGLFDLAACQLTLPALSAFLEALVSANETNLKYSDEGQRDGTKALFVLQKMNSTVIAASGRPLVHLMRIWPIISAHFAESADSKFPEVVSRIAVVALGDMARAMLQNERPGFVFNQSLISVFQDILLTDAGTDEIQEHIIAILTSFVQDRSTQLGSGWKPIFGAIKAIRIGTSAPGQQNVVHGAALDLLKKYFELDNAKVFVPTALEAISCVSHYLQATAEGNCDEMSEEYRDTAVGETVFTYVWLIQSMLGDAFRDPGNETPAVPILLHRLKLRESALDSVDANSGWHRFSAHLPPLAAVLRPESILGVSPTDLASPPRPGSEALPWAEFTDPQKSVAELLLTLIESLAGLVLTSTRQIHSQVIAALTELVSSFRDPKISGIGPDMGAFALCSLIFPIFQKWVRRESGITFSPEAARSAKSLKQASGMLAQVVAEYLTDRPDALWSRRLLFDCHNLLNEYIAHPSRTISGIGTACIRHLILTASPVYSDELWLTTARSLWRTSSITLAPIRRLCFHYFADSTDFCGDIGEVAIGVRKDAIDRDYTELQLMAKQVFGLEESGFGRSPSPLPGALRQTRTTTTTSIDSEHVPTTPISPFPAACPPKQQPYVFNLSKADSATPESVSLEDVVTSLLNQQSLLQLISCILLGEQTPILSGTPGTSSSESIKPSNTALGVLLHCLDAAAAVANLFDERPALKLLLQKFCGLDHAANLYRITIAAQSVKLMAIYKFAREESPNSEDRPHLKGLESSLRQLLEALRKLDAEAAANKLASFARDRIDQKINISLIENPDSAAKDDNFKAFNVVSAAKCLEEYKRQKRVESLPSNRANPFIAKADSKTALFSSEKLQISQLNDLDVRILAYTEVLALTLERYAADDDATFDSLLPTLSPIVVDFMRVATSLRARNVVADLLDRLAARGMIKKDSKPEETSEASVSGNAS